MPANIEHLLRCPLRLWASTPIAITRYGRIHGQLWLTNCTSHFLPVHRIGCCMAKPSSPSGVALEYRWVGVSHVVVEDWQRPLVFPANKRSFTRASLHLSSSSIKRAPFDERELQHQGASSHNSNLLLPSKSWRMGVSTIYNASRMSPSIFLGDHTFRLLDSWHTRLNDRAPNIIYTFT